MDLLCPTSQSCSAVILARTILHCPLQEAKPHRLRPFAKFLTTTSTYHSYQVPSASLTLNKIYNMEGKELTFFLRILFFCDCHNCLLMQNICHIYISSRHIYMTFPDVFSLALPHSQYSFTDFLGVFLFLTFLLSFISLLPYNFSHIETYIYIYPRKLT